MKVYDFYSCEDDKLIASFTEKHESLARHFESLFSPKVYCKVSEFNKK